MKINKKILILSLLATLILPSIASAQVVCNCSLSVGCMACHVAQQVVIVGTWMVIIAWIITGCLFLMAQGEPGNLTKAKTALIVSIAGTIIVGLAYSGAIVTLISNSFGLS